MANTIEYAEVLQKSLDRTAVVDATSGWMELNDDMVKYSGGRDVKIPDIEMDGLGDYERNKGFVEGSVSLSWKTHTMTQDRGRKFSIDENDVDESGFILSAATIMGEFQRVHVVPEMDAYRYSKIGSVCMEKSLLTDSYVPEESTVLSKLLYDIAAVQEKVGDNVPLVISISMSVANILSNSEKLSKRLDVTDFAQGDVTTKVRSLDGIHPLRRVPSSRMKTKFIFRDGKTVGQESGGFKAADDAKDINWIITPKDVPVAVSKTDKLRIFDPETNQAARSWSMDYRKYHDLWVPARKLETCWVNIRQAKG